MSNNNIEELLSDGSIIGVAGASGTGKTTLMAELTEEPRFRKLVYIDGDGSGMTVKAIIKNPDLCEHWVVPPNCTTALDTLRWYRERMAAAVKVPGVGSIIVEGIARLYEDAVGEAFYIDSLKRGAKAMEGGRNAQRQYQGPANLIRAFLQGVGSMQVAARGLERPIPIFVSCNTKVLQNEEQKTSYEMPSLSVNLAGVYKSRMDALLHIKRNGKVLRVFTDAQGDETYRKMRHAPSAAAVARLQNPTMIQILNTWADCLAQETALVAQHVNA